MSSSLGSTPDGAAWCLKALHPSDPMVEVRGLPDRSSVPSMFVNYQTTFRIAPPSGSTENWNFVAQLHPNPANFGYWNLISDDGLGIGTFNAIPNAQLAGATIVEKSNTWAAMAERWRLAYFGATVHFDGPALSNQGTLAVCQRPYAPRMRTLAAKNVDGAYVTYPNVCFPDGSWYSSWTRGADYPNFEATAAYPNSYMSEAKEGCYIPLRLTKTCQQWQSVSDRVCWARPVNPPTYVGGCITLPTTAYTMDYPHPGIDGAFFNAAGTASAAAALPKNGSDVVADVCGRNLSVNTGFVVEIRVGFEIQCEPGSTLSPFLKTSPAYDGQAMRSYFAVSRELKDAYPADYNDLGKLWDVIRGACRFLSPVLVGVPKVGPILSGAAAMIGAIPSGAKAARIQSAAALDREREVVKDAISHKSGPSLSGPRRFRAGNSSAIALEIHQAFQREISRANKSNSSLKKASKGTKRKSRKG